MDLWNDRVHTRLMPELAGNKAELLDAEVTVRAHEALSFNVGQYRPWLSRGFRTGLPVQALVDRGAVVDAFRIDRDVGVTALGRPAGGRFEYYLGVLSGAPRSAAGLYTARLVFAPLGGVPYTQTPYLGSASRPRFALGLAGHVYGRHVEGRPDLGASADLAASAGRIAALAEGFWRRGLVARDSWGAYGQLSVLLVKRWLDLAGRVGAMNRGNAFELHTEAGLNLYLAGHHAKLQLSYGHTATWPAPHTAIAQAQFMI